MIPLQFRDIKRDKGNVIHRSFFSNLHNDQIFSCGKLIKGIIVCHIFQLVFTEQPDM